MDLGKLFEPEETVGNIWHDWASQIGAETFHVDAAVTLAEVRKSATVLFRALGGSHAVDLGEAATTRTSHRRSFRRALTHGAEAIIRPSFDGERLRLPPVIGCFEDRELNRAAFLWLTAAAALAQVDFNQLPDDEREAGVRDVGYIRHNVAVSSKILNECPGLRPRYEAMRAAVLDGRNAGGGPLDDAVRDHLSDRSPTIAEHAASARTRIAPVVFWLDFLRPAHGGPHAPDAAQEQGPPPAAAMTKRKLGERRDLDQADRKDSFIVHRFESILTWVESMNINRSVDDDDDENAQKAADDQDKITLSKHHKKAASRLRLSLDLSPAEAEHERLSDVFTYPEWNHRTSSLMRNHCRVLEAPARPAKDRRSILDRRRAEKVRRQFETLAPRRILRPRQQDGSELDIDALIRSRAQLAATGRGSDRVYMASRQIERDLSVALLLDTSRSTEADMGGTCVIDVARDALSALAHGLDACGDRFGVWGFSSLRRKRVFVARCKDFDEPMSRRIDEAIASLKPGHYTRLGAAIRHCADRLQDEASARRLLIVLTDGKPNDIDHYEGQHGIEDSRVAVRQARRAGLSLHGIVIDEDGQDWFARIFGRGGFTLLPRPERLHVALPEIYRSLTQEV